MKKLLVPILLVLLFSVVALDVGPVHATICMVTVGSSPASPVNGHYFIYVNGIAVDTPFSDSCSNGTVYSFSADATVNGGSGLTYVFSSWSDGGARSHSVTINSGFSIIAYYTGTYVLTVQSGSGGTTSPGAGAYSEPAYSNPSIQAYPSFGYRWDHWIYDGAADYADGNPVSVYMDASHTVKPVFAAILLQFSNLNVSPTTTTPGATLTFSGKLYLQGTSTPPANGDYNIQVKLSGLSVGVDHTLVSGSWSLTASAPGFAGTYTYTCTATNTPTPGTFSAVTVGYSLVISVNAPNGTTTPAAGSYLYNPATVVSVLASPNPGYTLDHWLVDSSILYYDNPHSITMNGDHTIEAFFLASSPPPSDTAPPGFGTVTANVTYAGQPVQLSCPVSDNVALSVYRFSWNNTGTWQNQTDVSASGASVTALFNGTWNGTIGNVVSVKVYANDTSNNWAVSGATNFLLLDSIGPTYAGTSLNSTVAGSTGLFSVLWSDNVNVSGSIFQSNMSGVLTNSSWVAFTVFHTSTSAYANVSAVLPGVVGNVVEWQSFCNDTGNNWNGTGLQTFSLTAPLAVNSTALIVFRQGGGGLLYVNGLLAADNATLNCSLGSTLSLAAVANSGYSFAAFVWTGSYGVTSPQDYVVSGNDTVWSYFSVVTVPSGSSGSSGGSSSASPIVHVEDAYVSVDQGSSASFTLRVSWSGGGSLTVTGVMAGGNFSGWIIPVDVLPKADSSGVLVLNVKCTVPLSTLPTQYSVPVSATVSTASGGAIGFGTVYVTVSSGTGLTLLEEAMTVAFILISFIVGVYGFVRRH